MAEDMTVMKKETSHWWLFVRHQASRPSPWLQSTLGDLDKKTKAILKLIDQDADSFAKRAEMYYEKRAELISTVEDLYRMHRSLAERYDQLKSDRLLTNMEPTKYASETSVGVTDQIFDSSSENSHGEECAKSEVDDPEEGEFGRERADDKVREVEVKVENAEMRDELMELRDELERLKQENMFQKDLLLQKDEEKREVIRQLSLAMELMRLDNVKLRVRLETTLGQRALFLSCRIWKMCFPRSFKGCCSKSGKLGGF